MKGFCKSSGWGDSTLNKYLLYLNFHHLKTQILKGHLFNFCQFYRWTKVMLHHLHPHWVYSDDQMTNELWPSSLLWAFTKIPHHWVKILCFFFLVNYLFPLGFKKCMRYWLKINQTKAQFLNIRGLVYLKGDTRRNR